MLTIGFICMTGFQMFSTCARLLAKSRAPAPNDAAGPVREIIARFWVKLYLPEL